MWRRQRHHGVFPFAGARYRLLRYEARAGVEAGSGIFSAADVKDPAWKDDPGWATCTTPTASDVPVDQMRFMRFDGKSWERFGELLTRN